MNTGSTKETALDTCKRVLTEQYITVAEAAEAIGWAESTVRRHLADKYGYLKGGKLGGRWYVYRSPFVNAQIEQRRRERAEWNQYVASVVKREVQGAFA